MALKKTVTFNEIEVPDAYIKVVNPSIHDENTMVTFSVFYMVEPSAKSFASIMLQCPYDLEGENPVKQAYEHMKTLEEFTGAVDC